VGHINDHYPRFNHHVGRRKASDACHTAQVGKKPAFFVLSDKLLDYKDKLGVRLNLDRVRKIG